MNNSVGGFDVLLQEGRAVAVGHREDRLATGFRDDQKFTAAGNEAALVDLAGVLCSILLTFVSWRLFQKAR